jgi:hypothetical protein
MMVLSTVYVKAFFALGLRKPGQNGHYRMGETSFVNS